MTRGHQLVEAPRSKALFLFRPQLRRSRQGRKWLMLGGESGLTWMWCAKDGSSDSDERA